MLCHLLLYLSDFAGMPIPVLCIDKLFWCIFIRIHRIITYAVIFSSHISIHYIAPIRYPGNPYIISEYDRSCFFETKADCTKAKSEAKDFLNTALQKKSQDRMSHLQK